MEIRDAVSLIEEAVGDSSGRWADLGAGGGTFTRALADVLAPRSTIFAVDSDARALASLASGVKGVITVNADFTSTFELPGLGGDLLDGVLIANALHFVRDAEGTLTQLVRRIRVGGKVVIVEYDRRAASRWVPYPIPSARWPELAELAGLSDPRVTATKPSEYSGMLYAATATRRI